MLDKVSRESSRRVDHRLAQLDAYSRISILPSGRIDGTSSHPGWSVFSPSDYGGQGSVPSRPPTSTKNQEVRHSKRYLIRLSDPFTPSSYLLAFAASSPVRGGNAAIHRTMLPNSCHVR